MSLSNLLEIKAALEALDIRDADVRVTIKNGEVEVEPYETCTIG
jgi:hypothetical protein